MARASSTINVAITGDSKKLQGAIRGADKSVKGFGSSMKSAAVGIGAALAGVFAISKGFDFLQDSVKESDRASDALSNLNRIIGKVNTKKIERVAGNFHDIGLSSGDVLELSVAFARIARTIGIKPKAIAQYADDVAEVGKALALVDEKGRDALTWIELIAKAAGKPAKGTSKQLQALGLGASAAAIERTTIGLALERSGKTLAKDLTEAEKNAARLEVIMRKLKPVIAEALANPDVELQQERLRARVKDLEKEIGDKLQPIIGDLLQSLLDIGESQWVSDMMLGLKTVQVGFEVFQKDVLPPLISDLKLGAKTVEVALSQAGDEAEIMGGRVFDALKPIGDGVNAVEDQFVDWFAAIGNGTNDAVDNFVKLGGQIVSFVTDAKAVLGGLANLLNDIFNHDFSGKFSVVTPGTRTSRGSPGSGDRQISQAVQREKERNGLGGHGP